MTKYESMVIKCQEVKESRAKEGGDRVNTESERGNEGDER